ncbi:MAG: hypothetical protein H6730_17605 [Deltaproteobacteria bacterium]|nr:hypothetical protein [Deltaproteobacteria bacterium]
MKVAVDKEALGRHEVPDLLAIGVTTTDYVGHLVGAGTATRRSTRCSGGRPPGALFDALDRTLGGGPVLIVLSADHGIHPHPEKAPLLGMSALRVSKDRLMGAAQAVLLTGARVQDIDAPQSILRPPPRRRPAGPRPQGGGGAHGRGGRRRGPRPRRRGPASPSPSPPSSRAPSSWGGGPTQLRVVPHAYISKVDAEGRGVGSGTALPTSTISPSWCSGWAWRPRRVDRRPVDMTRWRPPSPRCSGIPPPRRFPRCARRRTPEPEERKHHAL